MLRRVILGCAVLAVAAATAAADHAGPQARKQSSEEPGTIGISLGGGMNGFAGAEARGVIGPGVGWDVRMTTLDNRHVRAELSYLGSTQELIDDSGVSLRSHGVQGSLRINVIPTWRVEPFFFMGVGWARFSVTRNEQQAFTSPDHVLDIPFGFGAAYHVGSFVFDVRGALSVVTGAQIVNVMDESASMNRFSLRASVGVEL